MYAFIMLCLGFIGMECGLTESCYKAGDKTSTCPLVITSESRKDE